MGYTAVNISFIISLLTVCDIGNIIVLLFPLLKKAAARVGELPSEKLRLPYFCQQVMTYWLWWWSYFITPSPCVRVCVFVYKNNLNFPSLCPCWLLTLQHEAKSPMLIAISLGVMLAEAGWMQTSWEKDGCTWFKPSFGLQCGWSAKDLQHERKGKLIFWSLVFMSWIF